MRSAAHKEDQPDPLPDPRVLRAEAARLRLAVASALAAIEREPGSEQLADEVILLGRRLADNTAALEGQAVDAAIRAADYAAGVADERERAAKAARGPRSHRRTSGAAASSGGWKQGVLTAVKVLIPAAAAGTWAAVKGSARHSARLGLTAHTVRLAAMATTGVGVAAATAVIVLAPNVTHTPPGSAGTGPNPAASIQAATPAPSTSLAGSVRHAKKAAKGGGKRLLNGSGVPVSWIGTNSPQASSSSASSSSAPSVQASVAVGPAVLTVSTTAIDLASLTSDTITLSATGTGWVSWKVDTWDAATGTNQADLDFSATHGVLQAGQSAEVTVTVDPAQALDGDAQEVFTIGGVSVTASLPSLVASVVPSPVASVVASPIPSGL